MTRRRTGMDPRIGLRDPVGDSYHTMPRGGRAMQHRLTRSEIAEEAAAEGKEREDRFTAARRTGTVCKPLSTRRVGYGTREEIDAARRAAQDSLAYAEAPPCPFCGVRSVHHAELGCKRWNPTR